MILSCHIPEIVEAVVHEKSSLLPGAIKKKPATDEPNKQVFNGSAGK
jgi:hypothetical protein